MAIVEWFKRFTNIIIIITYVMFPITGDRSIGIEIKRTTLGTDQMHTLYNNWLNCSRMHGIPARTRNFGTTYSHVKRPFQDSQLIGNVCLCPLERTFVLMNNGLQCVKNTYLCYGGNGKYYPVPQSPYNEKEHNV